MVQSGEEVPACLILLYSYCPSGKMEENEDIPTDLLSRGLESGNLQVKQEKHDQLIYGCMADKSKSFEHGRVLVVVLLCYAQITWT
jgi:hypothetical protein